MYIISVHNKIQKMKYESGHKIFKDYSQCFTRQNIYSLKNISDFIDMINLSCSIFLILYNIENKIGKEIILRVWWLKTPHESTSTSKKVYKNFLNSFLSIVLTVFYDFNIST